MIRCGLFCSTFWADLKTLRIIRESQFLICPLRKRVGVVWSRLLQSIDRQPPGREPVMLRWNEPDSFIPAFSSREQLQ
ncbi:hypothetical protein AVEN_144638-1, partial [Araneus ventricosus]